jgi:6-phosphogluconate dehydrogenase
VTQDPAAPSSADRVTLGMVGLGRMGANLVRRAMADGHHAVVYDPQASAVDALTADGATGSTTLEALVAALPTPRAVWVMVPAGAITESVVAELTALLEPGDCLIDGGNSYYRDDIRRGEAAASKGIDYLDVGTSGGVWGLDRGYCLMIGGPDRAVDRLSPLWDTIAPGFAAAPRTEGREGDPSPAERGWLHCGPGGAGHFVKMVHNGIEYGLMAVPRAERPHATGKVAPTLTPDRSSAIRSSTSTTSTCPPSPRWRRGKRRRLWRSTSPRWP